MSKTMESLATVNSFIRTLLALAVFGGLAAASWFGYATYRARQVQTEENLQQLVSTQQELRDTQATLNRVKSELDETAVALRQSQVQIGELREDVQRKAQQIEKLETSLRLLKVTHRIARLTVIDQGPDTDTGEVHTTVEFQEVNDSGQTLGEAKRFRIKGDVIYLDHWVVKFDEKYVEQSDIDRSTSLVLFRRLFGEFQEPQDGYALDEQGGRPRAYSSGGQVSEFEQKIWADFWAIANDSQKAEQLGIRAAHGEAPSIKVQQGKSYRILLRAADGLTITPDTAPAPVPNSAT